MSRGEKVRGIKSATGDWHGVKVGVGVNSQGGACVCEYPGGDWWGMNVQGEVVCVNIQGVIGGG